MSNRCDGDGHEHESDADKGAGGERAHGSD
jgi:hypothetical protein